MLTPNGTGRLTGRPLRVALLSSVRSPGVEHLLGRSTAGAPYRFVAAVLTDDSNPVRDPLEAAGVPTVIRDLRVWYGERGIPVGDMGARRRFDLETAALLAPFRPELVVLCGYLWVVTESLLWIYGGRTINVHDADLAVPGPDGAPRYRGLHSTRDAVVAGEPETRSTVHLVTEEVDDGPILVRSRAFPVHSMVDDLRRWGGEDALGAYAYAQREWMMRSCWGPLLDEAIRRFADGPARALDARAVGEAGGAPGFDSGRPGRLRVV